MVRGWNINGPLSGYEAIHPKPPLTPLLGRKVVQVGVVVGISDRTVGGEFLYLLARDGKTEEICIGKIF